MAWSRTTTIRIMGMKKRALHIHVPPVLHEVLNHLASKGHKGLIVGGAVRDALLGHEPKDLDVEVYGTGYDELHDVLRQHGKVNLVGRAFGVAKLRDKEGNEYDFTLPRRDSKVGPGHRDFTTTFDPSITPEEAASRRDFTVNAMGYDPVRGELHDYFKGEEDLRGRVLRHTSGAFSEDPLRVLRGMQFASRYGMTVHPDTAKLSQSIAHEYHTLPKERVSEEFMKLTKGAEPGRAIDYLKQTGWHENFPALHAIYGVKQEPQWHPEGDLEVHTAHSMDAAAKIADREGLQGEDRASLVLGAMCHDFGKPSTTRTDDQGRIISHGHDTAGEPITRDFLGKIGIKQSITDRVAPLVVSHMQHLNYEHGISSRTVRRLAERLRPSNIKELSMVMEADHSGRPTLPGGMPEGAQKMLDKAAESHVTEKPMKPLVQGRHVLPYFGGEPGPHIGEVLKDAHEAQLNGEINTEEEGQEWLKKRFSKEGHRFHYHVAPTEVRESIEEHGLDSGKGVSPWPEGFVKSPGNYLYQSEDEAQNYIENDLDDPDEERFPLDQDWDTWKVDTKPYEVHGDPEEAGWEKNPKDPHDPPGWRHVVYQPIKPEHVERVDSTYIEKKAQNDKKTSKMYHIAPSEARDSIEHHGLDPSKLKEVTEYSSDEKHIYLFKDPKEADWYKGYMEEYPPRSTMDLYEVDTQGLKVKKDYGLNGEYADEGDEDTAHYVSAPIPRERVKRIGSWEGFPFDQRHQEGPRARDVEPERTPEGHFVLYHGTTRAGARAILGDKVFRPDDLGMVGFGTTPGAARIYGLMKEPRQGGGVLLRAVIDKDWLSKQRAIHEVGGSGHDQFLIGSPDFSKDWEGVPAQAVREVGVHTAARVAMPHDDDFIDGMSQEEYNRRRQTGFEVVERDNCPEKDEEGRPCILLEGHKGDHGSFIDEYPGAKRWKTASWQDVRNKAVRLRNANLVDITLMDDDVIVSDVTGDHGTYHCVLYRQYPGSFAITTWECSCKWGDWAFKRQHTYIGRLCSHALATLYEAHGREYKKTASSEYQLCKACYGRGSLERGGPACDQCRGSGLQEHHEFTKDYPLAPGEGPDDCSICGRDADFSFHLGHVGEAGAQARKCWQCSGTGKWENTCSRCRGEGYDPVEEGECIQCDGSCGGDVTVPCDKCKGSGLVIPSDDDWELAGMTPEEIDQQRARHLGSHRGKGSFADEFLRFASEVEKTASRSTLTIYPQARRPVTLSVEMATDAGSIQQGLMYRPMLPMMSGMVFIPNYVPSRTGMWMKNCLIPLTAMFWDRAGVIREIINMKVCRAGDQCPVYYPKSPWWGAVEVNPSLVRTYGITIGSKVELVK